jgi:hypothetical protein
MNHASTNQPLRYDRKTLLLIVFSHGTISVFASVYYEHRDLLNMHRHLCANLLTAVYNAGEHGDRLSNI